MSDDRRDKPRLPWYRPRNFVLASGLIIAALIGRVLFIAYTATPGHAIDYAQRMNELARTTQPGDPDEPNRWEQFVAILHDYAALEIRCDSSAVASIGQRLDLAFAYDTSDVEDASAGMVRAEARACLDAIRASDIYDRLDAFIDRSPVYREFPPGEFLMMSLYPDLGPSRALSRACAAEFRVALEEGRNDDAIRAARHTLALARISMHQPILVGYLVGISQAQLVIEQAREAALADELNTETARRLLGVLNDFKQPGTANALRGEELGMLDLIQRLHTDDGDGNGMFLPNEMRKLDLVSPAPATFQHPILNGLGVFFPDKKSTTTRAEHFYSTAKSQTRMTPYARRHQMDLEQFVSREYADFNSILGLLLPAVSRIIQHADHAALHLDATRILLAITIFHAEHGEYPDSLDQLAPRILTNLPADGFAPDGMFRYLKRDPTPDDPRPFILYSVGADFTDDGGQYFDNLGALSPRGKGTDFVVNPPPTPDGASRN